MSDPEVFLAWLATLVWALLGLFATYWWVLVLLGLWGMLLSVRSDLAATRWELWEVRAAVADLVQRFEGTQAENDRSPPARQRRPRLTAASRKEWREWSERYYQKSRQRREPDTNPTDSEGEPFSPDPGGEFHQTADCQHSPTTLLVIKQHRTKLRGVFQNSLSTATVNVV